MKEEASQLEQAISIAVKAHQGQRDKSGEAFILHAMRVMLGVEDPIAMQAAILHDVVEDTSVSLDDLATAGIAPAAIRAVDLLTRENQEDSPTDYAEYVIRIKSDPIARKVKISDLKDNYKIDRVALRTDQTAEDLRRIQKYVLSFQFLSDEMSAAEYQRRMSQIA